MRKLIVLRQRYFGYSNKNTVRNNRKIFFCTISLREIIVSVQLQ